MGTLAYQFDPIGVNSGGLPWLRELGSRIQDLMGPSLPRMLYNQVGRGRLE